MIFFKIIFLLFVYDIIGFYVNSKLLKISTFFNIPIGFVFLLSLFQIVTFPLMLFNMSFKIVYLVILPIILLFIVYILFKLHKEYFSNLKNAFKSTEMYFYIFITLVFGLIMMILTISNIDQVAYATPTTSTILTDIIYYNSGFRTITVDPSSAHGLNCLPLFNAMWIKLLNVSTLEFVFMQFRMVESFIIVGMYALVNQLYFKGKKSTLFLFVLGLLGFHLVSASVYSFDDTVLLFVGNLGTMYMYLLLGPLTLILFKVENKLIFYLIGILMFSFAVTYSLIPVMVVYGLILSMIFKDNKFFIYGLLTILYCMLFYFSAYAIVVLLLAIIIYVIYLFLKDNDKIVWIIYCLVIGAMVLLAGPKLLIFGDRNNILLTPFIFLIIYMRSDDYNKDIGKFIGFMLLFVFLIQSDRQLLAFQFSVISVRATIFFLTPFLIIHLIDKLGKLKIPIFMIGSGLVLFLLTFSNVAFNKIDLVDYIELRKTYGSHAQAVVGNENVYDLMDYPFEKNSDILILDDWSAIDQHQYKGSSLSNINMYIGVTNIYYRETTEFCKESSDCYVLVNKHYEENGVVMNTDLSSLTPIVETPDFIMVKVQSSDEVKQIINNMYGR